MLSYHIVSELHILLRAKRRVQNTQYLSFTIRADEQYNIFYGHRFFIQFTLHPQFVVGDPFKILNGTRHPSQIIIEI